MTLVVLTEHGIYADRRLTLKVPVVDQGGKNVQIEGTTDEYRKIGGTEVVDLDGEEIGAFAIFGNIETAQALIQYLEYTGLGTIKKAMSALSGFSIKFPDVSSGVAWLDSKGKPNWITVNSQGYQVNTSDESVVALGSGAGFFDTVYLSTNDVQAALLSALEKDPQSSTDVYDYWDRENMTITTHRIENGAATPTLEKFIAGEQASQG